MQVINLCQHEVVVLDKDEKTVINRYPASGQVARLSPKTVLLRLLPDGTPMTTTEFGEVEDLPAENVTKLLIVSRVLFDRFPERNDLTYPNELVRDEKGNVIGCRSLGC